MLESLKIYIVEFGVKELAPSIIRGVFAGLVGLIVAHQVVLSKVGMDYIPSTEDLVIHLKMVRSWLTVMAATGGFTGLFRTIQHHAVATVTGAPQSGDQRQGPTVPEMGGQRKDDLK